MVCANDNFGRVVSVSGDGTRLIAGAFRNDARGANAGHVKVYEKTSGSWMQLGNTIQGHSGDQAGIKVSISRDGSRVAYGGPGLISARGVVRVYELSASSFWTQVGGDIRGEANGDAAQGVALSENGSRIYVGSPLSTNSGSVRMFDYASGSWTQKGAKIYGSGRGFGYQLATSNNGSRVVVGQKQYDYGPGGSNAGHARIYEYTPSQTSRHPHGWTQLGTDDTATLNGDGGKDYFGEGVSMSGDGATVVIGADSYSPNPGYARVLAWSSGSWTQVGQEIVGETASFSPGISVAMNEDGSIVAVGQAQNAGTSTDAAVPNGHARVFRYSSSTGAWAQLGGDVDGNLAGGEAGSSVALSSNGLTLAVGAPKASDNGQVSVFDFPPPSPPTPPPTPQTPPPAKPLAPSPASSAKVRVEAGGSLVVKAGAILNIGTAA